jgi:hypothetical protein
MMIHVLTAFQIISGVAWLISSFWLWPYAWRTFHGTGSVHDLMGTILVFVALNQSGFTSRWLIFPHSLASMEPHEMLYWIGLYALSSILAVAVMLGGRLVR